MSVVDQMKALVEELLGAELRRLREFLAAIRDDLRSDLRLIRAEFRPLRRLIREEIARLDARIDGRDTERWRRAPCRRSRRGCRGLRR